MYLKSIKLNMKLIVPQYFFSFFYNYKDNHYDNCWTIKKLLITLKYKEQQTEDRCKKLKMSEA